MARPNRSAQRRSELLPVVAATFAELGYRRTTTAELAARCDAQETALYRLWPDKRAMFTAAIGYVVERSKAVWTRALADRAPAQTTAEAVLAHETVHFGELGLYRILFAGLSETDDAEIQAALRAAYRGFHRFLVDLVQDHRGARGERPRPTAGTAVAAAGAAGAAGADPGATNPIAAGHVAWALIGLGTVASLAREFDLLTGRARSELLAAIGQHLLG